MSGFGDDAPEDATGPERASPVSWLFVDGNRLLLTGLFVGLTYVVLVAVSTLIGPLQREETSPMFYLFSALAGGNFTLVTIVISVSQLVVSRQLGTPGEIRDRIEVSNDFRETVEETSDVDVAPVTPTGFLHYLVEQAASLVRPLRREAAARDGEEWAELYEATDRLSAHLGRVESNLARPEVSLASALSVTLETNYSADIFRLETIRATYGERYPESLRDGLDLLSVRLRQVDVGRQYLKTLYVQDELSELSINLLYVGIPAVLASVVMLRGFSVGFETISPDVLFAFVPVGITVALAPLLMLFAYVLRITTVARRTIAITPFTMDVRESDRPSLDEH